MDADRELLFGLIALQAGAIDADQLSETCGATIGAAARTAADGPGGGAAGGLGGLATLTDDQRATIGAMVEGRLREHGGDARAALAATLDGRTLDAVREAAPGLAPTLEAVVGPDGGQLEAGRVLISSGRPGAGKDDDGRDPRYTLTRLHARGGMGQVWKARDAALGREIALKELRPDSSRDATAWSRFLYEAKVTARLEHPGVVPVYEMKGGDAPYYTMRFVRGRTLGEAARAYHKARAAGEARDADMVGLLSAFMSVCHAVAYAHSRGVIHRDLKGQNIVLGDYGEVMVLDWGLAKQIGEDALDPSPPPPPRGPVDPEAPTVDGPSLALATLPLDPSSGDAPEADPTPPTVAGEGTLAWPPPEADAPTIPPGAGPAPDAPPTAARGPSGAGPEGTLHGQVLGTPAYMAPEQAQGRHDDVDYRTDVYGLGAILYELLAGQPPFLARQASEILRLVVKEPPEPPRGFNPAVPPELQAICLKALAKRREDRYQTAAELAKDVQRHLADEPVAAYRDPWTRRASRWARKHRTAVAAAAALLATTTAASLIGTAVVDRWRDEAEAQGALARATVDDMYGRLGESWLEDRLDPIQKDFLEKTIAFYEGQTDRPSAADPAVRMEHGEMLRRMGDVYAKFGRREDADEAYRRGLALLRPLVESRPGDPRPRRILASTAGRCAEALFRADRFDEADALFAEAEALMRPAAASDAATPEDRRILARTLRWKGQSLRRRGDLRAAGPAYAGSRDLLEKALAAEPGSPEVRGDLAQAEDLLARYGREIGATEEAEAGSRRALRLLDSLVAEFPTLPRYREGLYHAVNELGVFAYDAGRLDEAEGLWGRGFREASRLAEDYPDRPEYALNLAGAGTNYGGLLAELGRYREAEPILRDAVARNEKGLEADPADNQVRFDLAKCRANLGHLLLKRGRADEAVAEIVKAAALNGELVRALPDVPRNAYFQATYERRLAEALDAAGKPGSIPALDRSLELLRRLTSARPDDARSRVEMGNVLSALGYRKMTGGDREGAARDFRAALAELDGASRSGKASDDARRATAIALNNLASLTKGPEAEELVRRSLAISEELARRDAPTAGDLQSLAIARTTLAERLRAAGRAADAAPLLDQAVEGMSGLVARSPTDPMLHYYMGYMLSRRSAAREKPEEARDGLRQAVAHGRKAVELSGGRIPSYRAMLAQDLAALFEADRKLSAYEDARRAAMELARSAADPADGCIAAARLMARAAPQALGDAGLAPDARRDQERRLLSGATLLLREAIDASPGVESRIKEDPAFKDLLSRAELRVLLGAVAEPTPPVE